MDNPVDLTLDSEQDLLQQYSLQEKELDFMLGAALPEIALRYCSPTMKVNTRKKRPDPEKPSLPPVPDQSKPVPPKKINKETLALQHLLEWKKTLRPASSIPPEPSSPKAVKRKRESPTLQQHLQDLRYQSERQEQDLLKRRQVFAQEMMEQYRLSQLPTPFPFESPSPVVSLSEADKKRMEKQLRFQNRLKTEGFYERILTWDLFEKTEKRKLRKIQDWFEDGAEYVKAFKEPFFEEMKADLVSAMSEIAPQHSVKISLQVYQETAHFVFLGSAAGTMPFKSIGEYMRNGDIVLCVEGENLQESGKFARPKSNYFLGICEKRVCENGTCQSEIVIKCGKNEGFESLKYAPKSFSLIFLESVQTKLREYKILHLAEFLELSPHIFRPSPSLPVSISSFPLSTSPLNPSQTQAVKSVLESSPGFTLIQGPPGTGKTYTLISILSQLLDHTETSQSGILVCAPSNAAIDEVVCRVIKGGIFNGNGEKRRNLKVIRVGTWRKDGNRGREDRAFTGKLLSEVETVTLEKLVQDKLREMGMEEDAVAVDRLKNRLGKIEKAKEKADESQLAKLKIEGKKLQVAISQEKHSKLMKGEKRRTIELDLLSSADLIFTTLSGAGSKHLETLDRRFEFVVIDEACQAVELSALIPLQYRARKVVLIGDPHQLPATTFSEEANRAGYNRSLFERLMHLGLPVIMLKEQYRMLSSIREFPSQAFYSGQLIDANPLPTCPNWIPAPTVLFVDLKSSHEIREQDGTSIANPAEALFVCDVYQQFRMYHGFGLNIGVVTPYRQQVFRIKRELKARFGKIANKDIEVNTVDGFQGREKDVIIFSAVRSSDQIGFLADTRRLNVAITRARFALWIVGKMETLQRHPTWARLLTYIRERQVFAQAANFQEIASLFVKRYPVPSSVSLRPYSSQLPPQSQKREPTNYSRLFASMVPRSETKIGIMEMIESRESGQTGKEMRQDQS